MKTEEQITRAFANQLGLTVEEFRAQEDEMFRIVFNRITPEARRTLMYHLLGDFMLAANAAPKEDPDGD